MEVARDSDRDFALWATIIQTRDVLAKARDNELGKYGITYVEARALFIINMIGNQATPAMISKWMFREHNTVTALLLRMENKELITRKRDSNRRNTWRIGLTEKGREAYQKSIARESLRVVFSVLTDEEREITIQALRKINDQTFEYIGETSEVINRETDDPGESGL